MHYLSKTERERQFGELRTIARQMREHIEIPADMDAPQRLGSMTLVRHAGGYFGLTTKHQFGGDDPKKVKYQDPRRFGISLRDRRLDLKTFNIYDYGRFIGRESDINDLRIFDYTGPVLAGQYNAERFLPMSRTFPTQLTKFPYTIMIGYPYELVPFEVDPYRFTSVRIAAFLCGNGAPTSDENVAEFRQIDAVDVHPDGMSGGACIALYRNEGNTVPVFDGMILSSSNRIFRCLRADAIKAALENLIGARQTSGS